MSGFDIGKRDHFIAKTVIFLITVVFDDVLLNKMHASFASHESQI